MRLIGALRRGGGRYGAMERHKLLIKGASSVNAIDRAIKADIIDSGVGAENPELLYAIDALSFNKVCTPRSAQ